MGSCGHYSGDRTPADSLAEAFFSTADPSIRGGAISHIAWSFINAEVDDDIRDRFGLLRDARFQHLIEEPGDKQELRDFHWFVKCGKFDPTWWLPRLAKVLELDSSLLGERYFIGKDLARAAESDPRASLEILEMLLSEGDEGGLAVAELGRNAVPMVIAKAMLSGDENLANDAVIFINQLGERGSRGLQADVDAIISGTVTQDDV